MTEVLNSNNDTASDASPIDDWGVFLRESLSGMFNIWLGIALAGAAFGTAIIPAIGTVIGFVLAGMAGAATSALATLLHIMMRGRLRLRTSASFAGATAGFTSWGFLGWRFFSGDSTYTVLQLITALLGSIGAVIATSVLLRRRGKSQAWDGIRTTRFSLADLMLFTAWLAIVLTAYRLTIAPEEGAEGAQLVFAGTIFVAMGVTECQRRAYRRVFPRKPEPEPKSVSARELDVNLETTVAAEPSSYP